MTEKKVGRNDPCPCGSGKKYKACCLKKTDTKKTFTPTGKRKFKAKVIDSAASAAVFSTSGAATPQGEGDPKILDQLRFRMSGHDYRTEETQTPQKQEKSEAPKENIPDHKVGDEFIPSADNFQVEEKD